MIWAALFGSVCLTGCATVQVDGDAAGPTEAVEIFGEQTVAQTFVSRERNLNRIDVRLRLPSERAETPDVVLDLYANQIGGSHLASVRIRGSRVREKRFNAFRFPAVSETKDRRLVFEVKAPSASEGQSVRVLATRGDEYPDGVLVTGGRELSGRDVVFRTFIRMDARQLAGAVADRMRSDRVFVVIYGLLITSVAGAFFWLLLRVRRIERE